MLLSSRGVIPARSTDPYHGKKAMFDFKCHIQEKCSVALSDWGEDEWRLVIWEETLELSEERLGANSIGGLVHA